MLSEPAPYEDGLPQDNSDLGLAPHGNRAPHGVHVRARRSGAAPLHRRSEPFQRSQSGMRSEGAAVEMSQSWCAARVAPMCKRWRDSGSVG